MADELELRIEGRAYAGWETATFFRTIEACAGSFSVELADLPSWSIGPGQRVQAFVDGELFLTGWVDHVKRSIDKDGRKLLVEGRDLAADLVDCSALLEASELRDVQLADLAALLADPLGVEVEIGEGVDQGERFDLVAVNQGESAWECLERCLRMRGLLAFSRPTGALLITRPSSRPASSAILEGQNLKSAELMRDHAGRYRNYLVTSQRPGDDEDFGDVIVFPSGTAQDAAARTTRSLILPAEQGASDDDCALRARWEAITRAARAMPASATVAGWRRQGGTHAGPRRLGGPLWTINERVRLASEALRVDEDLLVASCRYRRSKDEGTLTTLGFVRPDAFIPIPSVAPLSWDDLEIDQPGDGPGHATDPGVLNDPGTTDFDHFHNLMFGQE